MVDVSEYTDKWGIKVSINMTLEDLLALKYELIFNDGATIILDVLLKAIREYYHE